MCISYLKKNWEKNKANLPAKSQTETLNTALFLFRPHSPSVSVRPSDVCPSVHNFLVNTLASTNINQSSPYLVKIYMTIRAWMSFIMELIGPELFQLSALELENLPYLTMFTL